MKLKGFAKKGRFNHEGKKICQEGEVMPIGKCFCKEVDVLS